jgi:hypothetical protein
VRPATNDDDGDDEIDSLALTVEVSPLTITSADMMGTEEEIDNFMIRMYCSDRLLLIFDGIVQLSTCSRKRFCEITGLVSFIMFQYYNSAHVEETRS